MFIKPRKRNLRKKIIAHILYLAVLSSLFFLLYIVFFPKDYSIISPLGKSNIDSKKIEKILKNSNILFSGITVLSDNSYEVIVSDSGKIIISSKKDIAKQISSLQRMLRELTIEGKPFKSIDFRFLEPIISL